MSRLLVVATLCAASACGSKTKEPPAGKDDASVAVAAGAGDAAARPTPTRGRPALSPQAKAAYLTALRAGRREGKARRWPAAAALFEKALEAAPGDPRALSELGWAAFQAKDLARAHRATLESLAGTPDAKLRAASFYNLGRIHEARAEKTRAIAAYRKSLALRANETVQARLIALDPTQTPAAVLAATPLAGPYPSIEAFCVELSKTDAEMCDPAGDSEFDELVAKLALTPPLVAVDVFRSGWDENCSLALRTAKGWFIDAQFADCKELGGPWDRTVEVRRVELRDLTGDGVAELLLEYDTEYLRATGSSADDDVTDYYTRDDRIVQICGVGKSGVPSCAAPFRIKLDIGSQQGEGPVDFDSRYELAIVFSDGAVTIEHKSGTIDKDEAPALGKHRLVFP